jgi:hypothetical protein
VLAVLELNDQSLLMRAEEGALIQEPGFAYLSAEGIETGEVARAAAWKEPQHSVNQYWCQLNQKPLPGKYKWARHNADIAFTQLKKLWHGAGMPQSHIILVPGSFSNDQVSLVLGMIRALPAETSAVVDNALAMCLGPERDYLFVDLQLHQTVLSVCRFGGGAVSIAEQEVIPDLGMMQIYNRLTRHISDLVIRSYRYDPLHASESEQAICDRLPDWLGRLSWEPELSLKLNSEQGDLPFILHRADVQQILTERVSKMRSVIDRHRNFPLVFSHASRLLPAIFDEFSTAEVCAQAAGIDHVLLHQQLIVDQTAGLHRIRSLELGDIQSTGTTQSPSLATHLLYRDMALPLKAPVSIRIRDEGVQMSNKLDSSAELTLVLRNQTLEVMHQASGCEFDIPKNCLPGEHIMVGGHQLKLIEVVDG